MNSYDPTEIALEVEKMKENPHFLDDYESKDNKHNKHDGQADADDLERLLPSPEQQFKDAEKLTSLVNTTSRAGAGGTKAGLVGIRPAGGVAASKFIDDYVGVGRLKKDPDPAETNTALPTELQQRRADTKQPSVVIYTRCMDCMMAVPQTDVWPCMTYVPDYSQLPMDTSPTLRKQYDEEAAKWAALKLRPGEVICYIFHATCVMNSMNAARRKRLVVDASGTTQGEKELRERALRISQQVKDYIKKERDNPWTDIFYGDAKSR